MKRSRACGLPAASRTCGKPVRIAAIMPATARIWVGSTEGSHSLPNSQGISTGAVTIRIASSGTTVAAWTRVARSCRRVSWARSACARVDREGKPHHDPADLVLVDDAELEGAPVEADLGGAEPRREDRVVDVGDRHVQQAGA